MATALCYTASIERRGAIKNFSRFDGPELIPGGKPGARGCPQARALQAFARFVSTPIGGATALADVVSLQQWKCTGIYNEVCSKVGMHRETGARVPFGEPDYLSLVVNRSRRSFTARDHHVMDILRHHVVEAFRLPPPSFSTLAPLLEALESVIQRKSDSIGSFGCSCRVFPPSLPSSTSKRSFRRNDLSMAVGLLLCGNGLSESLRLLPRTLWPCVRGSL